MQYFLYFFFSIKTLLFLLQSITTHSYVLGEREKKGKYSAEKKIQFLATHFSIFIGWVFFLNEIRPKTDGKRNCFIALKPLKDM